MDHPVVALRLEEHVAAARPLAVQCHLDLTRFELVALVGTGIPHRHRSRAVLAGRDLAREGQILERVIFGVDGEVVAPGVRRDALRHGPRSEDPVVLQAQVPVQRPGSVLLHDETGLGRRRRPGGRDRARRFRGRREIPFRRVLRQRILRGAGARPAGRHDETLLGAGSAASRAAARARGVAGGPGVVAESAVPDFSSAVSRVTPEHGPRGVGHGVRIQGDPGISCRAWFGWSANAGIFWRGSGAPPPARRARTPCSTGKGTPGIAARPWRSHRCFFASLWNETGPERQCAVTSVQILPFGPSVARVVEAYNAAAHDDGRVGIRLRRSTRVRRPVRTRRRHRCARHRVRTAVHRRRRRRLGLRRRRRTRPRRNRTSRVLPARPAPREGE